MNERTSQINNFNNILPRSVYSEVDKELIEKKSNISGLGNIMSMQGSALFGNIGAGQGNIYRNPARRFYDPQINTTSIYLPQTLKQKNRWNRWFFNHDEMIGTVLELHAELPYSRFEMLIDDPYIRRQYEECVDITNFFSMLPLIDLEYQKVGEVIIHTPWNEKKGMWESIVIHNPDFIEIKYNPFADQESSIELIPDNELKGLIHSTKPEEQQLKKRLPKDIVKRVLNGKNIILDPSEVTHIARRSSPYDIRGTSMIERVFRLLMYEDKLREAQITIADNFIYPLKIFKLGDAQKGWIPPETHQRALAQMLQQAAFDPNFSLIYHYGLQVEYMTVADKIMRTDHEWDEINKKKMIALGVSQQFLNGEATFASANVGLQTQLARYKAKRDLFEEKFIKDKFFRKMAEKNEWYARDIREIRGQYRVKRSERELQERVILPKIVWHKKLMMRDDQSHLNFLNNVYAQGKGPVSAITLLMSMGLDLEDELLNKKKQEEIESRLGVWTHPPAQQGNVASRIKEKFKFGKSKNRVGAEESKIEIVDSNDVNKYDLISGNGESFIDSQLSVSEPQRLMKQELENDKVTTKELSTVDDQTWIGNLQSPAIPPEVVFLLTSYLSKVRTLPKKYGSIDKGIYNDIVSVSKHLTDIYLQGKLTAYSETGYIPIYKNYDTVTGELRDFSDMAMSNQFEDWLGIVSKIDMPEEYKIRNIRNLATTCFGIGQLKGYQEQGINYVKIGNVSSGDGITYKIGDILSRGWNMGGVLSPENEIVMFYACIEGYDDEDIGNTIDPHIQRYKTIYANGITIKNCPVEFSSQVERFANRTSKFLKKRYDNIFFVKDVMDLPEWEDEFKKKLKKSEIKIDDVILSARIFQEKILKRGKVATFTQNNNLYISSWVGIGDAPLISNILNSIEFDTEFIEKTFGRSYKSSNYDLNREEIDTYKMLGYIEPINPDEPIGWKISSLVESGQKDSIDEKIYLGKTWNASGKCLKSMYKSAPQVFNENLISWVNSPHKLPQNIKKAFEEC